MTTTGEAPVVLTIRCCSPSPSSPMAAPSPTSMTMVVLQVTNQLWLVAYYLWILSVEEIDTSIAFYWIQGFMVEAIPTTIYSWDHRYWFSHSLASLTLEVTSAILGTIIPETLSDPPSQVSLLCRTVSTRNNSINLLISPHPQSPLFFP